MKEVRQSLDLLDRWIEKNGWAGYDPYDIRGTKLFFENHNICLFKHI